MHSVPNRKLPLLPDHLQRFYNSSNIENIEDLRFICVISIMFFGFFRASELIQLKWKHITFTQNLDDLSKNSMIIFIEYSKTDITGKGVNVEISQTNHQYDPIELTRKLNAMTNPSDEDKLWCYSLDHLRNLLKKKLGEINEQNPSSYSLHSCRRGGAHAAAMAKVPDCDIKAHGRWLSDAYLLYTEVESRAAGRFITSKI